MFLCYYLFLVYKFVKRKAMFKWNSSEYPELDEINKTVDPYLSLFSLVREWRTLHGGLMDGKFLNLDAEIIRDKVRLFLVITN